MSLKTCCDKGVAPTLLEKRASKVGSMTFVDAVRVALLYRMLAYRYLLCRGDYGNIPSCHIEDYLTIVVIQQRLDT